MTTPQLSPFARGTRAANPGWIVVLSVFLSLILFEILNQVIILEYGSVYLIWLHIQATDLSTESLVPYAQFIVFVIFLMRFFIGSFRFHEEAAADAQHTYRVDSSFGTVFSTTMTLIMFSLFFLGAREVFATDKFYVILILIHLVDLFWFAVIWAYLGIKCGLRRSSPSVYPVIVFLIYTIISMLLIIGAIHVGASYTEKTYLEVLESDFNVMAFILAVVFVVSIADFYWMYGFYAQPRSFRAFLDQFDQSNKNLSESKMPTAYLAGPDVFCENQSEIANEKKDICQEQGFDAYFPSDGEVDWAIPDKSEIARQIFQDNEAAIRSADIVFANLTPFRGCSLDAGTSYEIGFARALGKPIFGYTNCSSDYFQRVKQAHTITEKHLDGATVYLDENKMLVENFELLENLMIVFAVENEDITITKAAESSDQKYQCQKAFRECVASTRCWLNEKPPMRICDFKRRPILA